MATKLGDRLLSRTITLVSMWCIVVGLVTVGLVGGLGRTRTSSADHPFRIVVTSGDSIISRGESVTLAGYLNSHDLFEITPTEVSLIIRSDNSPSELRMPMTADPSGAFYFTLPQVMGSFAYRIESDGVTSPLHTVTVADAMTLGVGTSIQIQPPKYAVQTRPEPPRDQFSDFDGVQFSTVQLQLGFSEPVQSAKLMWLPALSQSATTRITLATTLSEDHTRCATSFEVQESGTLQLTTVSKSMLVTTFVANVRSLLDQPPRFEKVLGLSGTTRDARPTDRLPIEVTVIDDWGVQSLMLEYRVNGNEAMTRTEPLSLPGLGSRRVEGLILVPLEGKVREGDTMQFRMIATDNRNIPGRSLGGQRTAYPATGWASLRVLSTARPLNEQEVVAHHARIHSLLNTAGKQATEATTEVEAIRAAGIADSGLSLDQGVRVRNALEKLSELHGQLEKLIAEHDAVAELRPMIASVRIALHSEAAATTAIEKLQSEVTSTGRTMALTASGSALHELVMKLNPLLIANDKLLQVRLDLKHLRQIRADQSELVELASKPGVTGDELVRRQQAIRNQLAGTISTSDICRQAITAYSQQQIKEFDAWLRSVLDDQQRLNQAADQWQVQSQQAYLAELVRQQRELAAQVEQFTQRTTMAARLAQTTPLARAPFDKAADGLIQGKLLDVLAEQEKAAAELDHFAERLGNAALARTDRHDAVLQLTRWQDDIRRRYADAVKQSGVATIPEATQKSFLVEQLALLSVVNQVGKLIADKTIIVASDAATTACDEAATAFRLRQPESLTTLQRAVDALNRFAAKVPSHAERLRTAKTSLELLRREQDGIGREVDAILSSLGPNPLTIPSTKVGGIITKQTELVTKLQELEVLDHTARRGIAVAVGYQAIADLRDGLPLDVGVSQQEFRRQMDRLRQVLERQTPGDDQALELARMQREVAERIATGPAPFGPDELRLLQQTQREINRQLTGLQVIGASGLHVMAIEKAQALETALRRAESAIPLRNQSHETLAALDLLAARMTGSESDLARVQRLNRERAAQAERAKVAGKLPNNAESTAEATRQVQRQIEELEQTRVGQAQAAKRKVLEALQRLRTVAEPDRQLVLQLAAAEAVQKLTDEMARNHDRTNTIRAIGPQFPSEAEQMQRLSGGGYLPTIEYAETARTLARNQRRIRNETAEMTANSHRVPKPLDADPIGELAIAQQQLADQFNTLSPSVKSDKVRSLAKQAVRDLQVGVLSDALLHVQVVVALLNEIDDAKSLRDTQSSLAARIEQNRSDRTQVFTRQARRLTELGAEVKRLATAMRTFIERAPPILGTVADSPLLQATEAIEKAAEQLSEATRDTNAGRGIASAGNRQAALKLLQTASELFDRLKPPGGTLVAEEIVSPQVGAALQNAEGLMAQAVREMSNPITRNESSKSLRGAVEMLQVAIETLSPGRSGK